MEKIRFGVVGTNFITDWVIAGARQDSRFSLDAVCSRRRDTGEAFASRHGIPKVFTSRVSCACPWESMSCARSLWLPMRKRPGG